MLEFHSEPLLLGLPPGQDTFQPEQQLLVQEGKVKLVASDGGNPGAVPLGQLDQVFVVPGLPGQTISVERHNRVGEAPSLPVKQLVISWAGFAKEGAFVVVGQDLSESPAKLLE